MATKQPRLVGVLALLAGCGGGASRAPKAASGDGARAASGPVEAVEVGPSAEASARDSRASAAPPPAPASEAYGGSKRSSAPPSRDDAIAREQAPSTRPGLGTEWGEARASHVRDVSFVRDASRPFATVTLHYDDRRGVDRLARVHARRDTSREVPAGGGAVTVSLRDAGGDPLEAVHVGDRTFVVGEAGQRYAIVLTNHTDHRFETVATVDGLDVVDGKPGSIDRRGYVLMPFATLEIEGFRQSAARVATFRFAAVADSYAAQTGSARNVGVIGVALFGERGDAFVPEDDVRLRDTASPFPADPRFARPPRR